MAGLEGLGLCWFDLVLGCLCVLVSGGSPPMSYPMYKAGQNEGTDPRQRYSNISYMDLVVGVEGGLDGDEPVEVAGRREGAGLFLF